MSAPLKFKPGDRVRWTSRGAWAYRRSDSDKHFEGELATVISGSYHSGVDDCLALVGVEWDLDHKITVCDQNWFGPEFVPVEQVIEATCAAFSGKS